MSAKPRRVAADMWLRLASRSPFHDNSSLRRRIEANMTAAQLDEAQTRPAAWQPHPVQEVLAMTIDLPAAAGAQRPWSPGLQGGALDRFKEAATIRRSGSDCPTLRKARRSGPRSPRSRPCDGNANKRCADNCREELDYVTPPVKPGGSRLRNSPDICSNTRTCRRCARCARRRRHPSRRCDIG
jgi:hypothetical protein